MSAKVQGKARAAEPSHGERQHNGHQHREGNSLEFLDPNTYTAHRLHHATAPHLDLTTRRVFVGPVPKGWLKNHRTEWYKNHLHLNLSRRIDTFAPGPDVVDTRKLTNLHERRPTQNTNARGADEAGGTVEDDLIDMSAALEDDLAESRSIPRSTNTAGQTDDGQSGRSVASADSIRPTRPAPVNIVIKTGASNNKYSQSASRTPGLDRGESWQTASETFGGHSNQSPIDGPSTWEDEGMSTHKSIEHEDTFEFDGAGSSRPPLLYTDMVTEDPVPLASGSEFGGSSLAPQSFEASNSLASLLIHDEARRKKVKPPSYAGRASRSLLKTPSFLSPSRLRSRAQSQTRDLGPEVSTNNDKISGGMVRFNTAVQVHERDRQLKLKLAELSRRRTLRVAVGHHHRIRHRDGEIIKMENMLVRVECVKAQISDEYDERESIKYDSQIIERWREFIVVCREGSSEELSMCIQLYKSRTVPAIDRQHVSSRSTLTIPLVPKTTHVNLYSSLDKSLVVWHPKKTHTMIYILRPRCSSSSVEWYTFLQRALGWAGPTSLQVHVPDLSVTITLPNPFAKVEKKLVESEVKEGDGTILQEERAIAGDLIKQSLITLRKCNQWNELLDQWEKQEKVGLAWRKYDRLEWIHGINEQRMYGTIGMQRTHVLELRPKIHYPTHTRVPAGEMTTEPPPVEGFLVRLSRGTGRNRQYGNLYFAKRYYWATHDNLFCFCRPARALPPPPPKLNVHDGVVPPTSQLIDKIPMIYGVAPYELDENGEVEWLASSGNKAFLERKDIEAYNEAERKVNTLLRAEGFIDLTRVERVELIRKDDDERGGQAGGGGGAGGDADGDGGEEDGNNDGVVEVDDLVSGDVYHEKVFKLALTNGLNVKFQTHNKQTRDEWVKRLRDLVVYWKARHLEDATFARKIKEENLRELHIDEEMEALVGQNARKWEVSHANASPMLYHACGLSSCRAITMSGPLYRKPRKHSTFALYHVVLCHGELIIFTHTLRHRTGSPIPTIHHERHSSVSLRGCFIYSGTATKNDLVYNNPSQGFDANGPVRHALPRMYEGGETSQDEEGMRTFVVWWKVFSGVVVGGTGGKAMVFKAMSRTVRDVWVVNIAMEIERLHTKAFEEIQVKP
ncbi:Pleckstrin homology domain-containing protein [Peziza echinospora]|nr:Pleckstrin homology domain-containing protein [Peziza echinospora]